MKKGFCLLRLKKYYVSKLARNFEPDVALIFLVITLSEIMTFDPQVAVGVKGGLPPQNLISFDPF